MAAAKSVMNHYAKLVNLHPGVKVEFGARGRGLFAAERIRAGSHILAVPREEWITPDAVRRRAPSSLIRQVNDVDARIGGEGRVAAATLTTLALLAREKEVLPYMATLPADAPDVPSLWTGERLKALAGSPAKAGAEQFKALTTAVHGALRLAVPCDDFLRLSCLVRSRAISSKASAEDGFTFALVPGLDLANHSHEPTAFKTPRGADVLQLVTSKDLGPGDEITISYGDLDNGRLLRVYGFAQQKNRHDFVVIAREDLAHYRGGRAPPPEVAGPDVLAIDSPLPPNALARLRAALMNTEDSINAGARGLEGGVNFRAPLSLRNERACLAVLQDTFHAKLRAYATGPDEDADILERGGLPDWERYAILTRLGEKHVLLSQLSKVDAALSIIGR